MAASNSFTASCEFPGGVLGLSSRLESVTSSLSVSFVVVVVVFTGMAPSTIRSPTWSSSSSSRLNGDSDNFGGDEDGLVNSCKKHVTTMIVV